jgi:4-hydroxy-3-polyprenylbenzoate decarboxylase
MSHNRPRRIVVGITGATGAVFGVRILQQLSTMDVETHLVMSHWGRRTIEHETTHSAEEVRALADVVHGIGDQAASISSGSFRTDAMVIAPCSVRTMAAIAHGLADNLITRTADVMLKERRQLLLLVRESPLNDIHLQNMLTVSRAGAVVLPPVPAFYSLPQTVDDIVDHIVGRALDQLGFERDDFPRWDGHMRRMHAENDASQTESPTPRPGGGVDAFADTFDEATQDADPGSSGL